MTDERHCVAATTGESFDRLIKIDEVCRRVGLGKSMIYELIKVGRFPPPHKIPAPDSPTPFASRWSELEVVGWINDVKDGFEGKRRKV